MRDTSRHSKDYLLSLTQMHSLRQRLEVSTVRFLQHQAPFETFVGCSTRHHILSCCTWECLKGFLRLVQQLCAESLGVA